MDTVGRESQGGLEYHGQDVRVNFASLCLLSQVGLIVLVILLHSLSQFVQQFLKL